MQKIFKFIVIAAVALSLSTLGTAAPKENHPIKVLKARVQNQDGRGDFGTARGNVTVWIQNVTDVAVDGVKMEVELFNDSRRKVETLKRDIGELEPGKKKVLTFEWDVIAERQVKPRIWVEYNAGRKKPVRFKGDPPVW